MTITTVGIDLAKNVFAVHGVDQNGRTVLVKPKVSRAALPELIASLPPCVIGMEACSGAHYWARLFRQYGHEPRLMAAKFVSPYRMAGKSGGEGKGIGVADTGVGIFNQHLAFFRWCNINFNNLQGLPWCKCNGST